MIRCAKCGKMYDYDRRNGICPECCRYNRKDSAAEMEESLHEKYDSAPQVHSQEGAHYGVHRKNGDKSFHVKTDTSRKAARKEWVESAAGFQTKNVKESVPKQRKNRGAGLIACIIVIISVVSTLSGLDLDELPFGNRNSGSNREDYEENITTDTADGARLYVSLDALGTDLNGVDWSDYYLSLEDDLIEKLNDMVPEEGQQYYLLSAELSNNTDDETFVLRNVIENLTMEDDPELTFVQILSVTDDVVEADDYEFIDVLYMGSDDPLSFSGEMNVSTSIAGSGGQTYDLSCHVYYGE